MPNTVYNLADKTAPWRVDHGPIDTRLPNTVRTTPELWGETPPIGVRTGPAGDDVRR